MASAAAKRPQEELQARGKKLQASFFLRSEEGKASTNMEGKVVEGNVKEGNAPRTVGPREELARKRMRKWMEDRAAERKANKEGQAVEPAEDKSEGKEVMSTGGRIVMLTRTSPGGEKARDEAAATEGKASDTSGKTDALEGKAAATEGKASDTSGKTDALEGKATV